ncbi:serine hydrolase domain-containing protein, partial [Crossiella equi]
LAADPGTRWEYYNVNAQVAARLVEVVSGQGFADHLRAHVFGPLGMADSSAVDTEDDLPPSAAGHLKLFDHAVALPEPPGFGGGSGGVLSSAHDLAAWLIAQNNGGRGANGTAVLSPELIAVSHTPSPPARDYALGWTVGRTPAGATRIAHGGDLFTATAYQALLPDSGYGIAVLANTGTAYGEAPALAGRLLALLENRPVPAPTSPGVLVDWVVLGLAVLVLLLAVRGVRRARRWAEARTGVLGTALRLLPHTLPVLFPLTVHHVVSVLYRGRDVTWLQVHYLYASGMLLVYILCAACTTILAARLTALVRLRSPR